MQLLKPLWLLLTLATSSTGAEPPKYPNSISLTYTILGSSTSSTSSPKPLAEILYDPQTLKYHLSSWTPPSTSSLKSTSIDQTSQPLVRISLPNGGSTTVTTLSTFDPSLSQYIDLWLSSSSPEIISASISSISPAPLSDEQIRQKRKEERARAKGSPLPKPPPKQKTKSKKGAKKEGKAEEETAAGPVVKVTILKQAPGPEPHWISRKPVQVDSEGKEVPQEEAAEKTFLQKYWWVFMVGMLLMMSGGGGGGGGAEK